jgi:RimJ/RimL family protein N-acetyltransferase
VPRPALSLPWPPLRSALPSVALRPWGAGDDDAAALSAAWHDAEIVRWTAVPEARGEGDAARWIAGEAARRDAGLGIDLVIADPEALDVVLGEVGLVVVDPGRRWAEAGYWLTPRARGQGRAVAALRLFTHWVLHDLPIDRLLVRTDADNAAAGAVAEGAGYEPAGDLADGVRVWVRDAGVAERAGGTVPS